MQKRKLCPHHSHASDVRVETGPFVMESRGGKGGGGVGQLSFPTVELQVF